MKKSLVSIILPVYNSEKFIKDIISDIQQQTFSDWELIVIDDGSTDQSISLIRENYTSHQPVNFVKQSNQGSYAARNQGIKAANGDYIAFCDADDRWYEHHLQSIMDAYSRCPELDWIYANNKIVKQDEEQKKVISESNFDWNEKRKQFKKLQKTTDRDLNIINDPDAVSCQILYGLNAGVQFSVIKKELFEQYKLETSYRNEAGDQLAAIYALSKGYKFAYLNNIHGEYHIHDSNSSNASGSEEKLLKNRTAMLNGFIDAYYKYPLNRKAKSALRKRISNEYFWNIAYNILLKNNPQKAYQYFLKGLYWDFFDLRKLKTFIIRLPALLNMLLIKRN